MSKLVFGKNVEIGSSFVEAFAAAKAAKAEKGRHKTEAQQRKAAALPAGHEEGIQKLQQLWIAGIAARIAAFFGVEPKEFGFDLQLFADSSKKIWTRHQAEDVLAELIAEGDHAAYHCMNLKVVSSPEEDVDGKKHVVTKTTCAVDAVDWNCGSDSIRVYSVARARVGLNVKPVQRFSFSEVHLTVNSKGALKGEEVRPAEWLYRATLAYDTVGCHWYAYSRRDGKDLYYQLDGELKEISAERWFSIARTALIYNDCSTVTGAYASAGNLKKHKLVCSCMNEEGLSHLARSIAATGGISLLYTDPDRLGSAKAIAQANVRESAPYTANRPGPQIRVAAVFMGKWKLKDIVTGELFDGCDGWFAANQGLFRRFLEEHGYNVMTDEASVGIGTQARPFAFKGVATSVPGWFMADMALKEEGLCHGADVVVLCASKVTKEQQEQYRLGIESKGKEGDYAGKLVVVVYDDEIQFDPSDPASYELIDVLGDLNAQKAEQDLRRPSSLNILKLFRKKESVWKNGMGTSTQLLQSLIPVCPSLKAVMRLGFRAQMGKSVEDICRVEARSVTTQDVLSNIKQSRPVAADEVAAMDLSDAEKSVLSNKDYGMNVVNLAELLAPSYCWERDAALFKDELKAAYKAGKSRADRVRVPIDGTDFVLTPDFAAFYGEAILGLAENGDYQVFNNLLNKLGVEKGAGIKYPKQHIREMAKLAVQKELDIASKLAGNENAAKIAYLYANAGEAALLVACTKHLMDQEAGMDFDGDEMFVANVLTEEQRDEQIATIDWSDKTAAMEQYVKIQLAYYFGKVLSLVVSIDPDAEDKNAAKSSEKIKEVISAGSGFEAPKATVNHDKLWEGLKLGDNMPTREEVEKWQPLNPGNEAAVRNILNANLDVGIVTVIHLVFSDLFFKLEDMAGKTDDKLNADELKTVEVAKLIMTAVFENKEVSGQKYDGLRYERVGKLEIVRMDINEYHRIREASRTMELSRENMKNFFYDLVANGRMAQEFTIDACKTLMKVANIEYASDLRSKVKVLSRKEMDINFKYGANEGKIDIVQPNFGSKESPLYINDTRIAQIRGSKKIIVRDWAQNLKMEGYKAIVAAIKPLLANKPSFDSEFIEQLVDLATSYPEAAKLARSFQTMYMHLNTAQEAAILEAKMGIDDPVEKRLAESEVKAAHAGFFNAMGNTIRRGLAGFRRSLELKGLSKNEIAAMEAALLISLAYTDKKGNVDSKLSSFAYRVLHEEYMRFILDYACAEDDRVARFTEDALVWVRKDIEPGQDVTFSDGIGYLYGDKVAEAKDPLNGEYTIMEEDGRLFASTDVLNLMPLQKDNGTIVVETNLGSEWDCSHLGSIIKELAPDESGKARYVQLWGKKTWGQDGDELHDVIAAEDEDGAFGIGYVYFGHDNALNDVLDGIRGQVTNVTVYTDKSDPTKRTAIILLENCENVTGEEQERAYVAPVYEDLPIDEDWVKPVRKVKKMVFTPAEEAEPEVKEAARFKPAAGFKTVAIQDMDEGLSDEFDDMCIGE